MRRRYTSDRGQGFRRCFGAGSFGCSLLKVFSASLLSVHVCRSFDPLAAQDGTVTAKLRPKEDSDCRSFWSSASAQIGSRQEAEDELERAFQVSPKAIFAAPCQVELAIACQQDHLDSRLNNVDDLATDPASAYFLLLPVPTFAQVTRPSSRGSQSPSKMSRLIRLTSTYKKRGAQTAVLLALSLASDFGRLESGNSSNSHRPHCARTPASPTLGSVIGHLTST